MPEDFDERMRADDSAVERAVALLMEHFDWCEVFVGRHEPGRSGFDMTNNVGRGAIHARYGQIRQWVIVEDQRIRRYADRQLDEDEADDD